ncbi:MAG: aldo/keto reductase [Candidatus Hydrogenedentes bacterium]|nr:aldo/keto reductase [Candidatus Hydrogenedentota bacterium]
MEKRRLGRTDIEITPIGLGCWQFSNAVGLAGRFWPSLDEVDSRTIIKTALDRGINWFDTAEVYGWGVSEERVSDGLCAANVLPGEVVIATKWYPLFRTAGSITRTIGDRKGRLAPYPIDLHQVHFPAALATIPAQMKAMAKLVDRGEIRAVGVSNFSADQMRRAHAALHDHGLVLASNQVEYSLLKRGVESNGVMETAKELGITLIAYSPLAQGLLSGKFHDNPDLVRQRVGWRKFMRAFKRKGLERSRPVVEVLRRIAQKHGVTASQVALNWLVHFHGETVVAIPGATRPRQAEQNAGALAFTLEERELAEIDEASQAFL